MLVLIGALIIVVGAFVLAAINEFVDSLPGSDAGVSILAFRSWAKWYLGYPEAALKDADNALRDARKIGQAATLLLALTCTEWVHRLCRLYAEAGLLVNELVELADEKGAASRIGSGAP